MRAKRTDAEKYGRIAGAMRAVSRQIKYRADKIFL
jgi:hypothetical protein